MSTPTVRRAIISKAAEAFGRRINLSPPLVIAGPATCWISRSLEINDVSVGAAYFLGVGPVDEALQGLNRQWRAAFDQGKVQIQQDCPKRQEFSEQQELDIDRLGRVDQDRTGPFTDGLRVGACDDRSYSASVTFVLIDRWRRDVMARSMAKVVPIKEPIGTRVLSVRSHAGTFGFSMETVRSRHGAKARAFSEFPERNRGVQMEPRGG